MTHNVDMNILDNDAALLEELNVTELLRLAEEQGLGILSAAVPRSRLKAIVMGADDPIEQDLCPSITGRQQLQEFVEAYKEITYPQLPDCLGRCLTYGCPLGIALNSYIENEEHLV